MVLLSFLYGSHWTIFYSSHTIYNTDSNVTVDWMMTSGVVEINVLISRTFLNARHRAIRNRYYCRQITVVPRNHNGDDDDIIVLQ